MSIIAEPKPRSRKAGPKRTKSGAKTKTGVPPRKVRRQRAKAAKPGGPRAGTKHCLLWQGSPVFQRERFRRFRRRLTLKFATIMAASAMTAMSRAAA